MLLFSLYHHVDETYIQQVKDLVFPMEVLVERDLNKPSIPFDKVEILLDYGHNVTKETLNKMPALQWIQIFQTGVDQLPMEELKKRGILLTNIQDFHSIPISEYILTMMFYFTRSIPKYIRNQHKQQWDRSEKDGEIFEKTVAIFGAGTIGQVVAERCKLLGMHVIGVNTSGKPKPHFDDMYPMTEKENVLEKSDYVVLLLPATKDTYHAFGKKEFETMKDTAYLINAGRGTLINQEDLAESLDNDVIKGAALDVTDPEPLPAGHFLWETKNLLITPHMASITNRYIERGLEKVAVNWRAYQQQERPPYAIDLSKGY